jgi:hypothetical protein
MGVTQTWHGRAAYQGAATLRSSDATLNAQLERDESGTLRDQLLDELAVAAQDIEAALSDKPSAEQRRVLRNLLRAVRLGESIVVQVWESFHE